MPKKTLLASVLLLVAASNANAQFIPTQEWVASFRATAASQFNDYSAQATQFDNAIKQIPSTHPSAPGLIQAYGVASNNAYYWLVVYQELDQILNGPVLQDYTAPLQASRVWHLNQALITANRSLVYTATFSNGGQLSHVEPEADIHNDVAALLLYMLGHG